MLKIIIILVIIICLLLYKKEYFTVNSSSITFLKPQKSCMHLKNLNKSYTYNEHDLRLRNINSKIYYDEIYKFYCNNMISFNSKDKLLLNWCFENLRKHTPNNLLFIYDNVKISKYNNFIENGYPHTNNNVIFLSENFINSLLPYYNENNVKSMIKNLGIIIIHECIHLWQFRKPELFDKLYMKYWNFIKTEHIINSEKYEKKKRFNPDGKDTNYIFKYNNKYIWFLSIYNDNAINIGDVSYIGVYLEKVNNMFIITENTKHEKLLNIPEFSSFFNNITGNHYHVHELSAELLSIYYMKAMKISHDKFTNKAYRAMLIWLEKNL